ncbi:polysaccharide deacetylase family protein [Ginsengibacter hankyongi]|uniref:Polysaccharide deacetylase family protein n=1 Tax=Ginsengibacter hankyongi TaxID=2607284 RepID=A0A5J5IP68_9BACT|nr:polysaccharide deacetylase family protein [Ginsengibacter hankyongi]KAA9041754.1 polysaccharide deacetylase family protein [Ginsengibacter hankyongi]
MLYFVKTPAFIKKLYPECLWNVETNENILYITFDDGPTPQVTSSVLEVLKKYNAKATFFCIGKNVKEHFDIYKQIISDGHKPANHTFNHLNGWKTDDKKYLEDIAEASNIIDSGFFRPPYGRITKFQLRALQGEKFKLKTVMWDVLSGDFDVKISPENCYLNVINNAKAGSIIVFHDSVKAFPRLEYALPKFLDFFSAKGFQFKIL